MKLLLHGERFELSVDNKLHVLLCGCRGGQIFVHVVKWHQQSNYIHVKGCLSHLLSGMFRVSVSWLSFKMKKKQMKLQTGKVLLLENLQYFSYLMKHYKFAF